MHSFRILELQILTCSLYTYISLHYSDPQMVFAESTIIMPNLNPSTATVIVDGTSNLSVSNSSATTRFVSVHNNGTKKVSILMILIGTGVAILIVLIAIVVTTLVLLYLRKSTWPKPKSGYDGPYEILYRGDNQQAQQQSLQDLDPTGLYDQIKLSPSTGQAEIVSNAENEKINTLSSHQTASPNIDIKQCNKVTEQGNGSMSEQPTYAAVKKKQKKNKLMKRKKSGQKQNSAAEEKECSLTATDKIDVKHVQKTHDQIKHKEITPSFVDTTESSEALYTAVKKKSKDKNPDKEEKKPPPLPQSVEELYTIIKNVKGSAMEEEEGAPQIPPHTVEDLYTAVMKKPKNDTDCDTEAAPPIPPHTVEELYTAVQKGNAMKDPEDAPPIPPHIVEECC